MFLICFDLLSYLHAMFSSLHDSCCIHHQHQRINIMCWYDSARSTMYSVECYCVVAQKDILIVYEEGKKPEILHKIFRCWKIIIKNQRSSFSLSDPSPRLLCVFKAARGKHRNDIHNLEWATLRSSIQREKKSLFLLFRPGKKKVFFRRWKIVEILLSSRFDFHPRKGLTREKRSPLPKTSRNVLSENSRETESVVCK